VARTEFHRVRYAILAALALAAFVWLAIAVARGDTQAWDQAVHNDVPLIANDGLTAAAKFLTQFGGGWVLWPLGVAVGAMLALAGRRREIAWLGVTALGANLLNEGLKLLFHRPRPQPFLGFVSPATYSFPSGHALVSFCYYLTLAEILIGPGWPPARRVAVRVAVRATTVLLTALIGFSRVYLGVHYPTDVIGGYLGAVAWMASLRAAGFFTPGVNPPGR
jgi:undecaprenyl-diphosphatase